MSEHAQDLYRGTPRQIRRYTTRCITKGVVPFIRSSPGMGKSSIVRAIAEEYDLELIDERLSTRSPVDLAGIPNFNGNRATFVPFDVFPMRDTPLPVNAKGKERNGWLLFLDEFNSAPKSVQAAAYKLILDRMVGNTPLHDNVAIVCAGNLDTDRAIVNSLSTAMQSRLIHLEMMISHQEWLEDVALPQKYDERIIAFLHYKSGALMDFKPDHNDKTFCCPRTWEFMNNLVKGEDVVDEDTALYAGTITSTYAADFVQFTKVYKSLTSVREVLRDPKNARVPDDGATRWAVITHLLDKITDQNLGDLCIYVDRYSIEFRVLFYRSMLVYHPKFRHHPSFIKHAMDISRHLNPTNVV